MNARFARMIAVLLLMSSLHILLLPALFPTSAAPRSQPDAVTAEPNNSFGTATPLAVDAPLEETIAPAGDADWYIFDVDHQGELQIEITDVAEELAINVRVWNSEHDTVSDWFAPLAMGGESSGAVDLASPGHYFLEVADGDSSAESTEPYTLVISYTATADSDEPNNSFGTATPIAFDEPYQANILPAYDEDWYSFEVVTHGELTIEVTDVADDLAVSVRLWNKERDTISDWISPLAQGGDTKGILDLPEAGKYLLEVAGGSQERSTEPYSLQLSFTPAADAFEPNNSFGKATPFTLGTSVQANILPQYDADWYAITVDHHGELSIAVTDVPKGLAIQVRVWNADEETISNWLSPLAAGGNTLGTVDLPAAGSYYLEVVDAKNGRSIEPFNLTVSFIAAVDPNEANDSFGTATELNVGQSLQSNILPLYDSDWYQLDLPHQGELQFMASDVPSNLNINMRVWNSDEQTISDWFGPLAQGGNTNGIVDIPSAGTYYLEVTDGSSDARSIQPFTLQTLFIPAADEGEPNDSFEAATTAELDSTIPANILPAYDADWYKIEVSDSGDLHVLVTNVAPVLEIAFRLWNDQEETISDWVYPLAAGGNTEGIFTLEDAGTYYLEVVDNQSNRSIQPYLLRFSMEEIDPAEMTFTQTATNTDVVTDTVSTVVAGTETLTVTTIVVTTTVTVQASGDVSESGVVTATESTTNTSVITRPVTPTTGGSTGAAPSTPATPATPGGSAGAKEPAITPSTEITATEEITDGEEVTDTSAITETSTVTD